MELFEVLLVSVVLLTLYLGAAVLWRGPATAKLYGWMLIGDLVLALISLAARRETESATGDLLGFVAIGGAICLIIVPPLIRDLGRRALIRDRLRLAKFLVDLRELFQPGMGARQERELIDAILDVRAGNVDAAIEALARRRDALDDRARRRRLDERMVMTYLYARRWEDAVDHYEATFVADPGPMSPQLVVEMIRAYCEVGRLEPAAELIVRLESSPIAQEPMLSTLVNRARLVFLAFVGRTTAVEAIVAANGPLGEMPRSARSYWSGVARLNAGDRTGAKSDLTEALRHSGRDPRAREVAEQTLNRVDEPGQAGPHAIPSAVAELADKLTVLTKRRASEPRERAPRLDRVRLAKIPVTVALIAVNIAIATAIAWMYGSADSLVGLVRAGANLKSAVAVGEWWRLPASMFLHVGVLHLALNMYGLWVLGKLNEQIFGSLRFFVVYMTAGLCGAAASFVFGGPGTSAGASGAVFGLLGASIAELWLQRDKYPERWRKVLFGNLVFLTAANVAIGFAYPAIDQSAHIGGLIGGGALAALLSARVSSAAAGVMRVAIAALTVVCAGAIVYAGFGVATTRYRDTIARYPRHTLTLESLEVTVPEPWQQATPKLVVDRSLVVLMSLDAVPADGLLDDAIAAELESEAGGAAPERGFSSLRAATRASVTVPNPWRGRELDMQLDNGDSSQPYRMLVAGRTVGDQHWLATFYFPEPLSDDLTETVIAVLSSVRAASSTP